MPEPACERKECTPRTQVPLRLSVIYICGACEEKWSKAIYFVVHHGIYIHHMVFDLSYLVFGR